MRLLDIVSLLEHRYSLAAIVLYAAGVIQVSRFALIVSINKPQEKHKINLRISDSYNPTRVLLLFSSAIQQSTHPQKHKGTHIRKLLNNICRRGNRRRRRLYYL